MATPPIPPTPPPPPPPGTPPGRADVVLPEPLSEQLGEDEIGEQTEGEA